MRNNLVLDTNIWLSFIESLDFELLNDLSKAIEEGIISIILPEQVEKEFEKKLDKILKSVKAENQSFANDLAQIIFSVFKLSKRLTTLDTGVAKWVNSKKAPNHNASNYEDTIVLNTLLKLQKGTIFYFVSRDSDYRLSKDQYDLHPDIEETFRKEKLTIHFRVSLERTLFSDFKIRRIKENLGSQNELYNWKTFKLKVKNKDTLDQLSASVDYYYKELEFIPLSYLSNIYPFKENTQSETYFRGLTLTTNNKDLFTFFKQSLHHSEDSKPRINRDFFDANEKRIDEFERVLKKFNSNLVFYIQHDRETISIDISEATDVLCDGNFCLLYRHAIEDVSQKIDGFDNSPKGQLKQAYFHFKLKNLTQCLKITQNILKNTNRNDYPIIYSIAQKNLSVLRGISFWGDDEFIELKSKLKFSGENEILQKGINSISAYLWYDKFFDYKFYSLQDDLKKVEDRYKTHQGLGNAFISNVELTNIVRWAELLNTTSANGLLFERYSNIQEFAKLTFKHEVYSMEDRVVTRSLDFYLFRTTLPFLTTKDYTTIFDELGVQELRFSQKNIQGVYILFDAIIKNHSQISLLDPKHDYINYYFNQIKVIAYLLGYIHFSKRQTNYLLRAIHKINPHKNERRKRSVFNSLIDNRISAIDRESAQSYLKLLFTHNTDFTFNASHVFMLLDQFKSIKLTKKQLDFLLSNTIEKDTGYYKSQILYKLYQKYGELKDIVLQKVYESLDDDNFDIKVYILFTKKKIIAPSKKYDLSFFNIVLSKFENPKKRYYRDRNNEVIKNIDELNQYIDYIYFNRQKPLNDLEVFSGRSEYYDFLIDPKSFDTDTFDIHWFYIAYQSSFFAMKRILRDHKELNNFIADKILQTRNERYLRAFTHLTRFIDS